MPGGGMAGSFKSMVWDYYLPTDMHEASKNDWLWSSQYWSNYACIFNMQSLGAGDGNCFITDQNADMLRECNCIYGSVLEE